MFALRGLMLVVAASMVVSLLALGEPGAVRDVSAAGESIYWGAYVNGAPGDPRLMDTFEAHAGKRASVEMFAQPWASGGSYRPFPQANLQTIRDRGTIPMVDWASWDLLRGTHTSQPDFQLADIYNGAHDAFLVQYARAAAAWGKPFFLRFDAEMNGWWLAWSEQTNGNQPGDFVKAWRHVVDIFRQQGATNVTWVFCPNIVGPRSTPLAGLYPGDAYVDWMCLDGYNWGTDKGNSGWWSFSDVFQGAEYNGGFDSYLMSQQIAPTKPIMIGETASSQNGGDKAAWITSMLGTELPQRFPNVKALVWFNWNDGDPGKTWPIESSPSAQAAFAQGIASSYYAPNLFGTIAGASVKPLSPLAPPPMVLNPVADSCTRRSSPNSAACGTSRTLLADLTGTDTAFLRFDLTPLAGKTIVSARLFLKQSTESWASSLVPQVVRLVTDNAWKEQYLTYNNTVPISSIVLGTLAKAPPTSTWYQIPIATNVVQSRAGGLLSMAIQQDQGSDVLIFYAREAGAASAPELVVIYR